MYRRTFFVLICFAMHSLSFGAIDEGKVARHIDLLIANQLKEKQLKNQPKINDQTFLRRAYLDIVGRIPTATEYEQFMNSESSTRRIKLVNQLFESNGYVSHSFNYWADTLRATHKLKKTTGSPYLHWIKKSLESNMPYDQFVHELLTAEGPLFKAGNGAVGYYIRDFAMPTWIIWQIPCRSFWQRVWCVPSVMIILIKSGRRWIFVSWQHLHMALL